METTVGDLIRINGRKIYSVTPDTTLIDTLRLMADYKIGAVLVLDASGVLVGIFSERDYARKSVERDDLGRETPIKELMTPDVITVSPERTVQECMEFVTRRRIRHIPVVDEANGLIGLVSIGDLVKAALGEKEALLDEKQRLIRQLENYVSGSSS